MKIDWKWFAIILLALVVLALLSRNCSKRRSESVTTTTVRIDTLHATDTIFFPAPYRVDYKVPYLLKIDTAAIIRDYFNEKYYSLEYRDTAIEAVTDVKVKGNAIEMAALDYTITQRNTLTTQTTFKEPKFSFWAGGGLTYSIPNKKPGFELQVGFGVKRSVFYAGYDFINQTPRIGWQYQFIRH